MPTAADAEEKLKTLAIVQACHVALPNRDRVGRKLAGKTLLEWVVRRTSDCQQLDAILVLVGDTPVERELCQQLPPDVQLVVGPEPDALSRFAAVVARHQAEAVVRVCADNPFVDPVMIDRLVTTAAAHPESDYISYCSSDGQPTILSSLGPFAEWCSATAIARADAEATRPVDRQGVTHYLHSHPQRFRVQLLRVPPRLDRSDVRLRIDGQENWEEIQGIYDALGPEEWDWNHLAGLLERQPTARKRKPLHQPFETSH